MDFKTRRIRKKPKPQRIKRKTTEFKAPKGHSSKKSDYSVHFATAGGSLLLIVLLLVGIYWAVSSLDFSGIVFSFGKSLVTDETGKTNILLIGTGGEGHDGADLTDTLIVASIDYDNLIVPMLSIPRDFYILPRQERINSVYFSTLAEGKTSKAAIQELENTVEEITGLEIQYYAKVDFGGFVDIVDALGGVDVDVENAIYDPYYPKGETIYYETFSIDAGPQTLNGETALKYARSRKTTSDFDRAKRQQQLLFAIKEKALSLDILTNPTKIGEIYDSVDDSIETNLSLGEILELGKLAEEFQKENLYPLVINDDPTSCGGLVYTPAREFFSGASVLLPVGEEYEYVNFFVGLVMNNIQSISNPTDEIQVLNGTKTEGLAYEGLNLLGRFCLPVVYYGNSTEKPLELSTIYYKTDEEGNPPQSLEMIQTLMPNLQTQEGIPPEYLETERRMNSTIVIELGEDYLQNRIEDPFKTLEFYRPPTTTSSNEEDDENDATTTTDESDDTTTGEEETTEPPVEETIPESDLTPNPAADPTPTTTEPEPAPNTPDNQQ